MTPVDDITHTQVKASVNAAEKRYRAAGRNDEADMFARQAALLALAANGVTDPETLRAQSRKMKRAQHA
jgi:hypothetical protein